MSHAVQPDGLTFHQLSMRDLDQVARGHGGPTVVGALRRADRSRRLFLLRAIVDEVGRHPELLGPLPSLDDAWDVLVSVEQTAPDVLDLVLAHPYVGTWAGYTTRLLRDQLTADGPIWMHVGHMHALAAAAAVRAELPVETRIPLWNGCAMLPTLGMARFVDESEHSTVDVHSDGSVVEIRAANETVLVPTDRFADADGWWGIRRVVTEEAGHRLAVRLDDLDPYRSLYRPVPPQRLADDELAIWHDLVDRAWRLIVQHLAEFAVAMPAGLDSLVPRPPVPFVNLSASTGEAFASAIIARPADAENLGATLIHEFQHIRLSGLLQLVTLHEEDPRQRFYTPWREDPRPVGGVLQGVYAFFGVTEFWRALAGVPGDDQRRAAYEFARWRAGTWLVLLSLRDDSALTEEGQRFVEGIAERLGPWQDEPVPADIAAMAAVVAADHQAGWRMRYLRPSTETVELIADQWLAGGEAPPLTEVDQPPVTVADGRWSWARAELIGLSVTDADLAKVWPTVPDVTEADYAYVTGRYQDAVDGYLHALAANPDSPPAWVGLGLALSGLDIDAPAARVLLRRPEVVRAVHRRIRESGAGVPAPDRLAVWIGQSLP